MLLLSTKTLFAAEVTAEKLTSVGVKVAVIVAFPRVGGDQLHVAEKFGDVPDVGVAKHLEIRLPDTKKRIRPATVEVTVIVIETPL